ncbi:ATP-binding cassette domain-containing protein [Vagococcus entomophilus]|uniref:Multidrug ABC transporter n=1 Tax=Vagococcus entomophilus TaxID=1160095 RepID=A0A430AJF9_9ENTE|nr:ABC transporter ATP-binding protein [Vagococcus entomophilus]RSU08231.1 multidrug ABC transporter [Vagococcus entomophilus]
MEIIDLSKKIEDKIVLSKINFTLEKGQIVGLLGRNGTGKTTLFRTITGEYLPDTGTIKIANRSLEVNRILKEKYFYLDTQYHALNPLTPKKIASFYQELYSSFDSTKFFELLDIYKLDINSKYKHLSKGTQGLFNMILAFSTNATYYFFDEPFDGLDVLVKKSVIQLLLKEASTGEKSIVISSHNLVELEALIDRVLILKGNQIIKDYTLDQTKEKMKKVQMVFSQKKIPAIVKENCKIVQVQGRVVIGIFPEITEYLQEKIDNEHPVLFEELPLNLEDLFVTELTEELDYKLFD